MGKTKIAIFIDGNTPGGRKVLDFLNPFDRRKSDIICAMIRWWIEEYGTNVPVQWLDRNYMDQKSVRPSFPVRTAAPGQPIKEQSVEAKAESQPQEAEQQLAEPRQPEADVSLIKAGLASFM